MKIRFYAQVQLHGLWIGISMIAMWPFQHISPYFLGAGMIIGMVCVMWNVIHRGSYFGRNDRYPYRLLYETSNEASPRVYSLEINQATLPSDFYYDAMMTTAGFLVLFYVSVFYFMGMNGFACILAYISMYPAMHMLRMVRCMRRSKLKATCAWQTSGILFDGLHPSTLFASRKILFWVLPSLERYMLSADADVYLISCPVDETQPALSYAISDRSASLYLVSAIGVIPVCYDQAGNQAAIEQLQNVTLQREAPVIQLDENPMPKPASSGVLTQWIVGLWIGFFFLLKGFYHIAGGDPHIALQVLPLVSFVFVWIGLELYSSELRDRGFARLRQAVGL